MYINKLVLIPLCMLDCISLKQKTEADKGTYTIHNDCLGGKLKLHLRAKSVLANQG